MPVNKNFPNYQKVVLTSKVVVDPKKYPTTPGPNRASRRQMVAEETRRPFQSIKFKVEMERHQAKMKKLAKIEARHEENRKRSAARKVILKNNNH